MKGWIWGPLSHISFDAEMEAHMRHTAAKQKDIVAFEIDSKREGMPDLQKLFTSLYNYCSKSNVPRMR
jgi:hypothetical protein